MHSGRLCFLEMTMSMIITESFISDPGLGNLMYHTLLERMTFENKRANFNDLRNQFAHYPLSPTIADWDQETGKGLTKFRDTPNSIRFSR
jgi:hypothetical protein